MSLENPEDDEIMVRLIDLPEELIHQVVSYLEPEPLALTTKPFAYWPPYLGKHLEIAHEENKETQSLAQTCRHFHDRLFATIHNQANINGAEISAKLYDAIEKNGRLRLSITTAHIHGNLSLKSVEFIFFLPNIRRVFFQGWSDWEPFEQETELNDGSSSSPNGVSPITHLYLTDCGAHEGALNQLLNWPKELKELWYEASQVEWDGHYGDGNEAPGFTCSAITRALSPLKDSLEKFVFTRSDPNHEGLGYSDAIDLREFSKLKELSIFHVLLIGYSEQATIWKNLPPNLETLEVWFDDPGYTNFICDGGPAGPERPDWLFGILEHKEERFSKLGRVRVISLEWWDEYQDVLLQDPDDGESEEARFRLPGELTGAFEERRVSYSVFLHDSRRWKVVVEGGLGFDEKWDEEEIEYPRNL